MSVSRSANSPLESRQSDRKKYMRVLYVTTYQGPDIVRERRIRRNRALGGSRKAELIAGALTRRGHEVFVVAGGTTAERTGAWYPVTRSHMRGNPEGETVVYGATVDWKGVGQLVSLLSAAHVVKREACRRFDVALIYNVNELTVGMALLCRLMGIPLVLEYEDAVDIVSRGTGLLRRLIWGALERSVRPHLRGVVAVNEALAHRVGHANTAVVPGVVDDEVCARGARRALPLSGPPPYTALFAGSLLPEKGVYQILEAAPHFRGRVRFVVVGSGPEEESLRERAATLQGQVEVLGFVPQHTLMRLMLSSDFLLSPHAHEPTGGLFPFKTVEYLASGGAVVATTAGAAGEGALEYCFVAQPSAVGLAEALERALADPALTQARASAGQRWAAERYSQDQSGRAIEAVLLRASRLDGPADAAGEAAPSWAEALSDSGGNRA
jgi:glycosyltransferase involved in cell wall biosynthesis